MNHLSSALSVHTTTLIKALYLMFEKTNIKINWCVKGDILGGQYHFSHTRTEQNRTELLL